jgi:glycosyltransferase involved in cell wall biosynthesis
LAASPTKVGESLAAGLPIVTNAGIGDCDQILAAHRLGIVLHEFSDAEYQRAAEAVCVLLADEKVRQRCYEFAERELSVVRVGGPRYAAVYERLLAQSPHDLAAIEGTMV